MVVRLGFLDRAVITIATLAFCSSLLRRLSSRSSRSGLLAKAAFSLPATTTSAKQHHQCATITARRDLALMSREEDTCPLLSLKDFLRERKRHPTRHIVIGNEAGDADSIISAIAHSYVEYIAGATATTTKVAVDKTPVVSISRRDLETQRPETVLLLELAGLPLATALDLLFFVDDPSWKQIVTPLNVTLVDHNRRADKFEQSNHNVVQIIDHHLDQGSHDGASRNIAFKNGKALVASTCTLVVERLVEVGKPPFPASLSVLLLGVILLDSVNLSEAAGKATPRDRAAIQALLDGTNWKKAILDPKVQRVLELNGTNDLPNTTTLFDALQNAKFERNFWKSLSARDGLRLDYKNFAYNNNKAGSFGMSTVLLPLQDFLAKENLVEGIRDYMKDMQIDFFAVMLTHTKENGHLNRELVLCGTGSFSLDDLVQFLLKDQDSLLLKEVSGGCVADTHAGLTIRCFEQGNAKASRKAVAPILFQYFEKA